MALWARKVSGLSRNGPQVAFSLSINVMAAMGQEEQLNKTNTEL